MEILVIGGGPVGCFTGIGLARRGHAVTVVDRDPGPGADGAWQRVGVMQGNAPHGWRGAAVRVLDAEMPDVVERLRAEGARFGELPGMPGMVTAMFARRPLVERVLREAAAAQPGLTWRTGHVASLTVEGGRVTGAVVDGGTVRADRVVVAAGRVSQVAADLQPVPEGGPCGTSYVFRTYRTRPGAAPYAAPFPSYAVGPGYASLVMPADNGVHHLLLVYPTAAPELQGLRSEEGFQRAAEAIPNLAPWADPEAYDPIDGVHVGGNLTNTYRGQTGPGTPRGVHFLGDSVCTLNPAAGRSMALHLPHAQVLLAALDDPALSDLDVTRVLDEWAEANLRPWWADHVLTDTALLRRFEGEEIDLEQPIPSDVVCAAAGVEPTYLAAVGPYQGMVAPPQVLAPLQEPVRRLLREGWRPPTPGPDRSELAALVARDGVGASVAG